MDFYQAIRELLDEKHRLDRLIAALEAIEDGRPAQETVVATPRRGRKYMDQEERREVSERMKRYWASRRNAASEGRAGASPLEEP